jgi:aspartate racemase
MSAVCFSKTIGIIGGAGPMASSYLYRKILDICQREYGANDYHEFPQIILISYPFTRGNPEKIRTDLALCLEKLKKVDATIVGLASHSFHGYLPDVSGVEFVHLVNESTRKVKSMGISKVLVLSAQKTIDLKLYEQDLECIYPTKTDQNEIHRIIREIAGGVIRMEQADTLKRIISSADSAQGVILACTELPFAHQANPLSDELPIVDTMEVLARRLIELAH